MSHGWFAIFVSGIFGDFISSHAACKPPDYAYTPTTSQQGNKQLYMTAQKLQPLELIS
jgi:hypothetical protein